jgi:hypothetical protein
MCLGISEDSHARLKSPESLLELQTGRAAFNPPLATIRRNCPCSAPIEIPIFFAINPPLSRHIYSDDHRTKNELLISSPVSWFSPKPGK